MLNVEGEGLIHGIEFFPNTLLTIQCNHFSFFSIIRKKKNLFDISGIYSFGSFATIVHNLLFLNFCTDTLKFVCA